MEAECVDRWEDCDLVFIAGVTMVERDDIEAAHTGGKPLVFSCDNIPRKSRNRRSRIFDNMRRYAEIADMVVYQSQWAAEYCRPVCGEGMVILNGVDKNIFYPSLIKPDHPIYLFAYHGKNDIKNFWLAHYLF